MPRFTVVPKCHSTCTSNQECTSPGAVCSCKLGFKLNSGKTDCEQIYCPRNKPLYCPSGLRHPKCKDIRFHCVDYPPVPGSVCSARCSSDPKQPDGDPKDPTRDIRKTTDPANQARLDKGLPLEIKCDPEGLWPSHTIYCGPINKAPTGITVSKLSISEGSKQKCFATIAVVSPDQDTHTISLSNNPLNRLYIDGTSLCWKVAPNYEAAKSWEFKLKATDLEGALFEQNFTLEIINVNERPINIRLVPNTLPENSPKGTKIGYVTAYDDDKNKISFEVLDTDDGMFETFTDPSNGKMNLRVAKDPNCDISYATTCLLNFERKPVRSIIIKAKDDGNPSLFNIQAVPIQLTDVDDKPANVSVAKGSQLNESMKVGDLLELATFDEDKDQTQTYTLLDDSSGMFKIVNNKLTITKTLNYEKDKVLQYDIKVRSVGPPPKSYSVESVITMKVSDVNEQPFDLQLTSSGAQIDYKINKPVVRENSPTGTVIGEITVKDEDQDDALTASLEGLGLSSPKVQISKPFSCSRVQTETYCKAVLAIAGALDYETMPELKFTIVATDTGGLKQKLPITLKVQDINEAPKDIEAKSPEGTIIDTLEIVENANDAFVAKLEGVKSDKYTKFKYSLLYSADGKFVILAGSNILKTGIQANLDFESKVNEYSVSVSVTDNGTVPLTYTKKFNVKVKDINEVPTTVTVSKNEVTENSAVGTDIATLTTEDPDNEESARQTFTYSLAVDAKGRFKVLGNKLQVASSAERCGASPCKINYEKDKSHVLMIKVVDSGKPPLSATISQEIVVKDANDAPTDVALSNDVVYENAKAGTEIGILSAKDEDAGQTVTFDLTQGQEFVTLTGNKLFTAKVFSYEETTKFSVTVVAKDSGSPILSKSQAFDISVKNVNEPPLCPTLADIPVDEDKASGSVIGKLDVTDGDNGETITFSQDNLKDVFGLTAPSCAKVTPSGTKCTASVKLMSSLDYEKQNNYEVTFRAKDADGLECSVKVKVIVKDKNDKPTGILLDGESKSTIRVTEGSTPDTVLTLSTQDPDAQDSHTYTIKEASVGAFCKIVGSIMQVSGSALDYEKVNEYVFHVITKDKGGLTFEKAFKLAVLNANDPPSSLVLDKKNVDENSAAETVVGKLSTTDPDAGQTTFVYTLLDADGRFKMDGDNLKVAASNVDCLKFGGTNCRLNHEVTPKVTVKVRVTDSGQPPLSKDGDFEILINDVNDAPRDLKLDGREVRQSAALDSEIGKLSLTDEDKGQTHTYTMTISSGNEGGHFKLKGALLVKNTANKLDVTKTYKLTVEAADSGNPVKKVTGTFDILVLKDENILKSAVFTKEGGSLVFDNDKAAVNENSKLGTVVGTLDYTISAGLTNVEVKLVGSSTFQLGAVDFKGEKVKVQVKVAGALNFEEKKTFTILTKLTSTNGESSKAFTIAVRDVNEKPEEITPSKVPLTVEENFKGQIASFTVKDPDNPDAHTFTLLDDGGGTFVITSPKGELLTSASANLDYETQDLYTIKVKATDKGGMSIDTAFTITVTDINEKPNDLSMSNAKIDENSPADTVIGTLQGKDPDNMKKQRQNLAYTLVDDADGRFKIVDGIKVVVAAANTGCLDRTSAVKCQLDFETKTSHNILVKVTDDGTPSPTSAEMSLTVEVTDVNEVPYGIVLSNSKISEAAKVGTEIGTPTASDQDKGQTLTFSVAGAAVETFIVVNGAVVLKKPVDFETLSSYKVTVVATDDGTPKMSASAEFTVSVLDVKEAPSSLTLKASGPASSDLTLGKIGVKENTAVGRVVAKLDMKDPDTNDKLTVKMDSTVLSAGTPTCKTLTQNGIAGTVCEADIKISEVTDYETKKQYTVKITVVDSSGKELTKDFVMTVIDENDPPTAIVINGKPALSTLSVAENTKGSDLATLTTTDQDVGQTHTYTMQGDNVDFTLTANGKLMVSSQAKLDYETAPATGIVLKARSSDGSLSVEKDIKIIVTDMNEVPSELTISANNVKEDAASGTAIGTLAVEDPDNSVKTRQTFTFRLIDTQLDKFAIVGDTLKVGSKPKFDFEKGPKTYKLSVGVTDSGTNAKEVLFPVTLTITDANDPPTNLALTGATVAEDAPLGTKVGVLSATDVDAGQTLKYSVEDNEKVAFGVEGDVLVVAGALDYELEGTVKVKVVASDNGSPPLSISKTFQITVTNVNEPLRYAKLYLSSWIQSEYKVDEGLEVGIKVGYLEVADPDKDETITAQMLEVTDGVLKVGTKKCQRTDVKYETTKCTFDINTARKITFQTSKSAYRLKLKASSLPASVILVSAPFMINNKNHEPTDIIVDSAKVREDAVGDNAEIGALRTTDIDSEDHHTYTLLSGTKYVEIVQVAEKPFLKAKAGELDYEAMETIPVKIKSVDSGKPPMSIEKTVVISVINVNEMPVVKALSNNEVSVTAAPGTIIGRVIVEEPDNEKENIQKHTCTLGANSDVFKMDTTTTPNAIKLAVKLTKIETVDISVICTDDGTPKLTSVLKSFKIHVKQAADVPKLLLLGGSLSVEENKADAVIGQFSVINELTGKELGVTITYQLSTNADKFLVAGSQLKMKVVPDFEKEDLLHVEVKASGKFVDKDFIITKTFKISVKNINEAPTAITATISNPVPENSQAGYEIGTLDSTDEDKGQTFTYTIEAVDSGHKATVADIKGDASLKSLFTIDGADIKVGGNLDFEKVSEYSLKVVTKDSGTPTMSYTGLVRIQVANLNEAPTAVKPTQLTVAENSPKDTIVHKLTVTDEDAGDTHTCIISKVGLPSNFPFAIKESDVVFVKVASIDYEKKSQYSFDLQCKDKAGLTFLQVITVMVTDVNEPPYEIKISPDSIPENTPKGGTACTIVAKDHESSKITYKVVSDAFSLQGTNTLITTIDLDFETKSTYDLKVNATDEGGLVTTADIVVKIKDVNEAPTAIKLSTQSVPENTPEGTEIGTLKVTDGDRGQTHTCTVPSSVPLTVIQGTKVTVSGPLDHEQTDVLKFSVTCTDNGNPVARATKELTLNIDDKNERPTSMTINPPDAVKEDAKVTTKVTTLTVIDPDVGDTISCTVIPANVPFKVVNVDKIQNILNLEVSGPLDYETAPKYDIKIQCTDDEFMIKKPLTITIANVNEPPTDIIMVNRAPIKSTSPAGYPISKLIAEDPDPGQTHVYEVVGPFSQSFAVIGRDILTLKTVIPQDILKLTKPMLSVEITVKDNGLSKALSFTKTLLIGVTHTEVKPTLTISNEDVKENTPVNSVVATFELNNMRDGKGGYDIRLVEDGDLPFKITGNDLILTAKLNYDTRSAYVIKVNVNYKKYTFDVIKTSFTLSVIRTNICIPKCKTNAMCDTNAGGAAECKCMKGYIKSPKNDGNCINEDDCKKYNPPCHNGGTCKDGIGEFSCTCPKEYGGDRCDVAMKPPPVCTPNPCKNQAVCVKDASSGYKCDCTPGWEGKQCKKNKDDCAAVKCYSGGVCKDLVNDYECSCPKNKIGLNCEYNAAACDASKCPGEICVPKFNAVGHLCAKQSAKTTITVPEGSRIQRSLLKLFKKEADNLFRRLDGIPPGKKQEDMPAMRIYILQGKQTTIVKRATTGNTLLSHVVYNDAGKVYNETDVISAMKTSCEGETDAICQGYIQRHKELLKKDEKKPEGGGDNMMFIYIGAGCGGAVLILVIIIVVVCVKKQRKA
ncbi:protocadherin Fat 4-like isoform X2 [Lineus longissimus]|uniref:protocadherin Fat 4-like isoform X2 n=1 Tax=Lineus longissimus TaxID=88925 RepID=UPI00315D846F